LSGAGGGDPVLLLRPLSLPGRLDQPVPLEALKRRVDLPDVERPDLACARLELVLQPQPVLRPVPQQGEERMRDTHGWLLGSNILSMYTRYSRTGASLSCESVGRRLADGRRPADRLVASPTWAS